VEEGAQVGAYRVLRRIGEGGMGAVWLAEHAMLGRRAAVKVLHSEYSNSSEIVTRFFNEARAATAIPDPGIVQIFDFGQHLDGSAYIVMELLDGEPLDRRLARYGALGLKDALRIMRQVASTLGAAHSGGIVHRDLKPENVFIVRDPEVPGGERAKVLDFGIAKLVGEHGGIKTKTQAVMGTPTYMSPEQCRGAGQVDHRSDVYAMGCMLFALLTGRPPFDAEGVGEIIAMHLREPPPAPSSLRPGVSAAVDQLVLRCLAKDPAQRFAHGGELAAAIGSLLTLVSQDAALGPSMAFAVASIPTTLSSAAGESGPTKRRRVAPAVALGAVVACSAVAIAVSREGSEPASPEPEPASPPVADVTVNQPPAAATLEQPAVNAGVAARAKEVMTRFVAWSRDHRGEPCPEIAALDAPAADPWGRVFRLTCIDQPGDQIIGVISAGPDGVPGTTDDIASWQLGRDVTEIVRGARWAAAAPTSTPATGPTNRPPEAKPAATRPATARPAMGARRKQPGGVELDEFGLPKKR
jgi:hypothetical protein